MCRSYKNQPKLRRICQCKFSFQICINRPEYFLFWGPWTLIFAVWQICSLLLKSPDKDERGKTKSKVFKAFWYFDIFKIGPYLLFHTVGGCIEPKHICKTFYTSSPPERIDQNLKELDTAANIINFCTSDLPCVLSNIKSSRPQFANFFLFWSLNSLLWQILLNWSEWL